MNGLAPRCVVLVDVGDDVGAALARTFARLGDGVVLFTDAVGGAAVAGVKGVEVLPMPANRRDSVHASVARVVKRFGRIDALVYADKTSPHPQVDILDLDEESWRASFEANLHVPFFFAQAAAAAMKAGSGGSIVLLSTSSGRVNFRRPSLCVSAAYEAAAAGLERLGRRLAAELGPSRITVNCMAPGNVDKPGLRRFIGKVAESTAREPDEVLREVTARQAIPGLIPVDHVVAQIVHLVSPASSFITGQTFLIAGGLDL